MRRPRGYRNRSKAKQSPIDRRPKDVLGSLDRRTARDALTVAIGVPQFLFLERQAAEPRAPPATVTRPEHLVPEGAQEGIRRICGIAPTPQPTRARACRRNALPRMLRSADPSRQVSPNQGRHFAGRTGGPRVTPRGPPKVDVSIVIRAARLLRDLGDQHRGGALTLALRRILEVACDRRRHMRTNGLFLLARSCRYPRAQPQFPWRAQPFYWEEPLAVELPPKSP